MVGIKVQYIGEKDTIAFDRNKTYAVMGVENGWFRIMTELDEDYLLPQNLFKIKSSMMKVRWKGKTESLVLTHDKVYDVETIEKGWYRIVDDSGESYLYPPKEFEIVED